jgi:hypothetical protein
LTVTVERRPEDRHPTHAGKKSPCPGAGRADADLAALAGHTLIPMTKWLLPVVRLISALLPTPMLLEALVL